MTVAHGLIYMSDAGGITLAASAAWVRNLDFVEGPTELARNRSAEGERMRWLNRIFLRGYTSTRGQLAIIAR